MVSSRTCFYLEGLKRFVTLDQAIHIIANAHKSMLGKGCSKKNAVQKMLKCKFELIWSMVKYSFDIWSHNGMFPDSEMLLNVMNLSS